MKQRWCGCWLMTFMEAQAGRLDAHLLRDDDQGVLLLRKEVEDAPDLEGVVVGDDQPAQVQVLPGAQRPAHLVEVLTIKVIGHLRQNQNRLFLQAADFNHNIIVLFFFKAALMKTAGKTLEFKSTLEKLRVVQRRGNVQQQRLHGDQRQGDGAVVCFKSISSEQEVELKRLHLCL